MIIDAFDNGMFPVSEYKDESEDESEDEISELNENINNVLFSRYFNYYDLVDMRNELASTKNSKEYRDQLSNIKSALDKLVIKSRDPSTSEDDKDEIKKNNECC